MRRRSSFASMVVVVFGLSCVPEARCEAPTSGSAPGSGSGPGSASAGEPRSLQECYLRVATTKATADMAYVAREICDALFKPERRSIFVLEGKAGVCVEWWFDQRGRYESPHAQCAFEAAGADTWTLACQHKDQAGKFTLLELTDRQGQYQRVGELVGVDPGRIFKTLAQCVRARAGK